MHLPSLQPPSCSLLTPWYLSRPARRALIITTRYVNNQWYWLRPEGGLVESCTRETFARRKRARHESVLSSCPEWQRRRRTLACVTHAGVTSPRHCWTAGQCWVNPLLAHCALATGYVDHDSSVICRGYLGISATTAAVTAWLLRRKGELER